MVKKFLLSAAVVGALATSAMAFDVYPANDLNSYAGVDVTGTKTTIQETNTSEGNALIFPAFFAQNGWSSTVRIINTADYAVVAKVVLYSGKDSKELRDFNIYLSANDEFMGKIYSPDGKQVVLESTDDSAPLEGTTANPYPFADKDHPLKDTLDVGKGYIQVIGMMAFKDSKGNFVTFHGKHPLEREVFQNLANLERGGKKDANFKFKNGVIINNTASTPLVNLDQSYTASDKNLYSDAPLTGNELTGDIRITDEVHGKDMVMPAVALKYSSTNAPNPSLVFVEGEKANLADAYITGSKYTKLPATTTPTGMAYDLNGVETALKGLSANSAYITYGDADIFNNYALLTSPFKRIIVQQDLANNGGKCKNALFTGCSYDTATNEINYGKVDLLASIYDTSENMMGAGQFSPATTPTITLTNELGSTGSLDVNDKTKLPYYLNQAATQGYTKGYVVLTNLKNGVKIPGILTQMIATKAGSATVTNWIVPAQK